MTCRWVNTKESPTSGAAILEVEFPSGYRIDQQVANADVRRAKRNSFNTLMNGKTAPDKIFWFFDKVREGNDGWTYMRWCCIFQWNIKGC